MIFPVSILGFFFFFFNLNVDFQAQIILRRCVLPAWCKRRTFRYERACGSVSEGTKRF